MTPAAAATRCERAIAEQRAFLGEFRDLARTSMADRYATLALLSSRGYSLEEIARATGYDHPEQVQVILRRLLQQDADGKETL